MVRRLDLGGLGFGGALVDINDDLQLDLFLGGAPGGSPACLYRTSGSGNELQFEPVRSFCGEELGTLLGGLAIDTERDGRMELLVYGRARAEVVHFDDDGDVSPRSSRSTVTSPWAG